MEQDSKFWFGDKSITTIGPNTYLEGSKFNFVYIEEGTVWFGQSTQVKMAYLTWIHLSGPLSILRTGPGTEINLGTSSTLSLNNNASLTTTGNRAKINLGPSSTFGLNNATLTAGKSPQSMLTLASALQPNKFRPKLKDQHWHWKRCLPEWGTCSRYHRFHRANLGQQSHVQRRRGKIDVPAHIPTNHH